MIADYLLTGVKSRRQMKTKEWIFSWGLQKLFAMYVEINNHKVFLSRRSSQLNKNKNLSNLSYQNIFAIKTNELSKPSLRIVMEML